MTEPVLDAENLCMQYGRIQALNNVSARVRRGEFVALLGPNGAGKTTLFNVLTGLHAAQSGNIRIDGFDVRRQAQSALARLGVVFQQPTIDLEMSVHQNLAFGAMLHGVPRVDRQQRIHDALHRLDMEDRAHEKVRVLSGGNRRRVELARALLHEPGLLLMDEASVGLDPANRHALQEDVHALCRTGGTGVLWATHLVDEAEYADRVIVLHAGNVLADMPPAELVKRQGTADLNAAFIAMTTTTAATA